MSCRTLTDQHEPLFIGDRAHAKVSCLLYPNGPAGAEPQRMCAMELVGGLQDFVCESLRKRRIGETGLHSRLIFEDPAQHVLDDFSVARVLSWTGIRR